MGYVLKVGLELFKTPYNPHFFIPYMGYVHHLFRRFRYYLQKNIITSMFMT
jgi:hypothetical protein